MPLLQKAEKAKVEKKKGSLSIAQIIMIVSACIFASWVIAYLGMQWSKGAGPGLRRMSKDVGADFALDKLLP